MAALGFCGHSLPRAPASHHRVLPLHGNTATHPPPTSAGRAALPPSSLKPLASVHRWLELFLAARRHVLHALVRYLLPLQSLHDLSLILPRFVCGLHPASRHTGLSLYSYCPPRHGYLGPRTHPLPLHPTTTPTRSSGAINAAPGALP